MSIASDKPELRCVFALIRHGEETIIYFIGILLSPSSADRTPKQKSKMEVKDAKILSLFEKYGKGNVT